MGRELYACRNGHEIMAWASYPCSQCGCMLEPCDSAAGMHEGRTDQDLQVIGGGDTLGDFVTKSEASHA